MDSGFPKPQWEPAAGEEILTYYSFPVVRELPRPRLLILLLLLGILPGLIYLLILRLRSVRGVLFITDRRAVLQETQKGIIFRQERISLLENDRVSLLDVGFSSAPRKKFLLFLIYDTTITLKIAADDFVAVDRTYYLKSFSRKPVLDCSEDCLKAVSDSGALLLETAT